MPADRPPGPPAASPFGPSLAGERPARAAAMPGREMLPPSRQRRAPSLRSMARRRFLVRLGKFLLPAAALALLSVVVLWPELDNGEERSRVSFRRSLQPQPEALRVVSPHFQGMDELNRPFTVTAATAEQPGSANVLNLTAPRADITMADGSWIYIEARTGRYDRDADHLDLQGEVTIFHDNGTMLRTGEALVKLGEGSASGDMPVAAQGPFGTLTAEGFRLSEQGAVVLFTGRSHAVLEGER